jgi:hypothetical protein
MRTDARRASEIRTWAGALALVGAAASAELAWLHMRAVQALGVICGGPAESHCAWCPLAVALLGIGAFLLKAPARQPAEVRAEIRSSRRV